MGCQDHIMVVIEKSSSGRCSELNTASKEEGKLVEEIISLRQTSP